MLKVATYLLLSSQLLVFGTLDRIQKAMEKKEYEKAYELILKGYEKEPENPGVAYYHAKLLFDESYKNYHLDSARLAIEDAIQKYENAPQELLDELLEEGIAGDSITLIHEKIRDQTYQNTLDDFSIAEAQIFREKFPQSIYEPQLTFKVDSIEFRQARLTNTEDALVSYLATHPSSVFRPKADSILDDLRFSALVATGTLKDYYQFHSTYPSTRHVIQVESYILNASTASHESHRYQQFMRLAKSATLKKKAADVLFYASGKQVYQGHPKLDSITAILDLAETSLYPVAQNGLYGFYDQHGASKIPALYTSVLEDYKCALLADDWVFVTKDRQGQIRTKSGDLVLTGIDNYRTISGAVGMVQKNNHWYVYHKSGFSILDQPVEDAEIIANKWVKVRRQNKWGLVSFLGLQVAEILYDDIYQEGSFWVFEKDDKYAVYTEELILSEIEERGVTLEFKFDDIELVDQNTLIGFKGERECLLDSSLNFLIPWGKYEIYPDQAGWYLKSRDGYKLYNQSAASLMDRYYTYLESNDGWLALKTETDWMLIPRQGDLQPSRAYDSIKLVNDFASVLIKEGAKTLQFTSGEARTLSEERIVTFQNREGYINLTDKDQSTILDSAGKVVVDGKFQRATFLSDSLIRVQSRGKQGLIHVSGDWVLNPVFDTIDEKDGLILTLIDGKIGCYDPRINKLMTTEYETRLVRMRNNYLAKKGGKYGIVDAGKKEIIAFSYDEIQLWNDTSFLVKEGTSYRIIDQSEEMLYEPFESIRMLVTNDQHAIYQFVMDGKYGLISTHFGELLHPEFTDIFNIGSAENPLIFADQHLDKAGYHVVSYVNQRGELIHSKAYTREEFDGILCDE